MSVYDLRDPAPHYGQVSMGSEDRTALSLAADRERARIFRKRWYETLWGRAAALGAVVAAVASVWQVVHR